MNESIHRLLWEDTDAFWKGLQQIAHEETQRQVISLELKEWYQELEQVLAKFPKFNMPYDV